MRTIFVLAVLTLSLAGYSAASVRGGAYEAAYQKGCMDQERTPNCDPAHTDYDTYQRQRDAVIKPGS